MTPWKPIATAPKDGTQVDLWHTGCQARLPDCAFIQGRCHPQGHAREGGGK